MLVGVAIVAATAALTLCNSLLTVINVIVTAVIAFTAIVVVQCYLQIGVVAQLQSPIAMSFNYCRISCGAFAKSCTFEMELHKCQKCTKKKTENIKKLCNH